MISVASLSCFVDWMIVFKSFISAIDQDYLNQNGHHNNASVHCKKNIIFRKDFFLKQRRQLAFRLPADETKYQMDYRNSEI
jgi:hypothetical protein